MDEGKQLSQSNRHVEKLRAILEDEQCRSVALEEAAEVGTTLITLFELLAAPGVQHE